MNDRSQVSGSAPPGSVNQWFRRASVTEIASLAVVSLNNIKTFVSSVRLPEETP